jgi:GH43 family beta-xylosidase
MQPYNKKLQTLVLLLGLAFFPFCNKNETGGGPEPPPAETGFKNPLLTGADPWVIQKGEYYYYMHTLGNRIAIWKTKAMSKLASAQITTVYSPTAGTANAQNIWAPELHFLDGKWYLYYTAGSGPDNTQRTWVLENSSADPTTGNWTDRGRIFANNADFWAIDGTVLEYNGNKYFLWSGRPDASVQNQNLYIAKMSNAWTLETPAVLLSKPELPWEINGGPVNEGPEIIKNSNGRVFLVYSASGCWTDDYALGILTLKTGGDPLLTADWTKSAQPVFSKKPENSAYGPGHNSFFKSPDGTQDWIIYHANTNSGEGCSEKRNIRIQAFSWSTEGSPVFGSPVKTNSSQALPAGE